MAIPSQVNHISACAGAAGLDLALRIVLGERLQTICCVERDSYAAATLVARMEEKNLDESPVWDDLTTFDGRPWAGLVDIISGGIPCQPFSVAGKQKGSNDHRWLWDDFFRVACETRCPVLYVENVAALLTFSRDFGRILRDLAQGGYVAEWLCLRASDVRASHRRTRVYILAYSKEWHREAGKRLRQRQPATEGTQSRTSGREHLVGDASALPSLPRSRQSGRKVSASTGHESNGGLGIANDEVGHAEGNNQRRHPDREHGQRQPVGGSGGQLANANSGRRSDVGRPDTQRANASPGNAGLGDSGRERLQPRRNHDGGDDRAESDSGSERVVNSEIERTRTVSEGQGQEGRGAPDTDRRGNGVGDATRARLEEWSGVGGNFGEELAAIKRDGLPIFPPGPGLGGHGVIADIARLIESGQLEAARSRYEAELRNTLRWREILAFDETVEPSIFRVAHELAPRVDRLRLTGEGVVPLAAAVAFTILADRLGLEV